MELLVVTLSLFAASALAVPLARRLPAWSARLLALVPAAGFVYFLSAQAAVVQGDFPEFAIPWAPSLGLVLSMRLDGLALLFALLVTGIGTLIILYTGGYFAGKPSLGRILSFLFLFMGSMLGLVLSDNLIVMFLFWELTSVSSYLLIGFSHESAESRRSALQALLVTGMGGLALLAGILLVGMSAGTFAAGELAANAGRIADDPLFPLAMGFILLGAFTKSAQIPFHFWLPNAMAAPTPVSAYLHSATMVKAGVYLLARLNPVFANSEAWADLLAGFGALTMLGGAMLGMLQTDLKRILAYTTLSVLGLLTMLLGVGTELALQSAIFFLLGHALYKACLFLCAGNVDHACHNRDVRSLRGLRFAMPATAAAACLAALSKSGFPPFYGFLGKEYAYKSGVALNDFAPAVLTVAFIGNALLMALAFKAGIHPFWGDPKKAKLDGPPHPLPATMWIPPLLLGVAGLVFGLLPGLFTLPLVTSAVSAIEGEPVKLKVALWHGFNLPLLLTGLTIATGLALYHTRWLTWKFRPLVLENLPIRFDRFYDQCLAALTKVAKWQTGILQNGLLHRYLTVFLLTTGLLLVWKLSKNGWGIALPMWSTFSPAATTAVIVMMTSAVVALTSRSRLVALVCLGITGYGVAFLFAYYGAADLAITQVVVETLTVVFFMALLHRLPFIREFSSRSGRLKDAVYAGFAGSIMTILVLKSQSLQLAHPISDQLAEWSYKEAHGRNVVNVILVDFRALDTFGEIAVLGIAAFGVWALMSLRKIEDDGEGKP